MVEPPAVSFLNIRIGTLKAQKRKLIGPNQLNPKAAAHMAMRFTLQICFYYYELLNVSYNSKSHHWWQQCFRTHTLNTRWVINLFSLLPLHFSISSPRTLAVVWRCNLCLQPARQHSRRWHAGFPGVWANLVPLSHIHTHNPVSSSHLLLSELFTQALRETLLEAEVCVAHLLFPEIMAWFVKWINSICRG